MTLKTVASFFFVFLLLRVFVFSRFAAAAEADQSTPTEEAAARFYFSPLGLFLPSLNRLKNQLSAYRTFGATYRKVAESEPTVQAVKPNATKATRRFTNSFPLTKTPVGKIEGRIVSSERLVKHIIFTAPDLRETLGHLRLEN